MRRVVVVLGATASGKSELALGLAERLDGEIVNADALQVYRGFDIGTAKPSAGERARVPHHLLDLKEPWESYSAGEFARRAREMIPEIAARGRLPIVVGGSGLYLRALVEGISPLPSSDPELRERLRRRLDRDGLEPLRRELARLDPASDRRLSPGDTQRTLRALEVVLATGRPLSEWLARQPAREGIDALRIGLTVPRAILYDRIALRVGRMVGSGWVEEVAGLLERGLEPSLPAFRAIGYRQIAGALRGDRSLDEALRQAVRETRRFAKRQDTWFRRERKVFWLAADEPGAALRRAVERIASSSTRGVNA